MMKSVPFLTWILALGTTLGASAAVPGNTATPSAWDEIVASGDAESLDFTALDRHVLDALAPDQVESFLRGADPSEIERLDGGTLDLLLSETVATATGESLRFVPVEPCRIANTRKALGKFADNEIRHYVVRGETTDYSPQGGDPGGCGILGLSEKVALQNSARAVLFSFRVVEPEGPGNLRAWASNQPQPPVPFLNYSSTAEGLKFNGVAIVPLCDGIGVDPCPFGDVKIRLTRTADLVVEVYGYFVPAVAEISAGPGLVGGGTDGSVSLEVHFAGSGSASTVARSDHAHAESVPPGAIVMWSGSLASIPAGWALCDGTNGTPDLRDRFILGAAAAEEPGSSGGAHFYSLSEDQLAPHGHPISIATAGAHSHGYSRPTAVDVIGVGLLANPFAPNLLWDPHARQTGVTTASGGHSHGATIGLAGAGSPIDNRPAFYKVAFIMKQ